MIRLGVKRIQSLTRSRMLAGVQPSAFFGGFIYKQDPPPPPLNANMSKDAVWAKVTDEIMSQINLPKGEHLHKLVELLGPKHMTYTVEDNVATILMDTPGSKVNVFNREFTFEMYMNIQRAVEDPNVKCVLVRSAKKDCFIAGADINMINVIKMEIEGRFMSQRFVNILNHIKNSKKPFIAAIQGSCLGGGLEFALACHYRIAMGDPKTKLGLPEVLLGLVPGGNGIRNLTDLIGVSNALPLLLTGSHINTKKAKSLGVVDDVFPTLGVSTEVGDLEAFEQHCASLARKFAEGSRRPPSRKKFSLSNPAKSFQHLMYSFPPLRFIVLKLADRQIKKKVHPEVVAPRAIIKVLEKKIEDSTAFGQLTCSRTSSSLIHLFKSREFCTKNRHGDPQVPVKKVAVLGAGLMGAGIAWASLERAKLNVVLKDTVEAGLARGHAQVKKILDQKVNRRKMLSFERDKLLNNLELSLDNESLRNADMVIEAVFEDINVKHKVLREVESIVPEHCIFASNTSALPITKIAEASKRPEKVIGMHYFSPVDKMMLLELVVTEKTSKDTLATAAKIGLDQDKVIIVVKDSPGFYTTRILAAFSFEVMRLVMEGTDPTTVNMICTELGFPIGAASLVDEVGIDVAYHISKDLFNAFGGRIGSQDRVDILKKLVDLKFLGKKSGRGFYNYKNGKLQSLNEEAVALFNPTKSIHQVPDLEDLKLRLMCRFVNEAVLCLQEGVLFNPMEGDLGAVFGLGFPFFTGGPFRYLDYVKPEEFLLQMERFQKNVNENEFTPCDLIVQMAKSKEKFYR